ncbi:MAG TPA: hypothetical protein VEX13_10545, partial [Chloroflexia bacterium]|nr:hypothetical protein [Chloroflexia bacterium]
MKYKWLWLILAFSFLTPVQAVMPHKAHACSCAGPATAQETLQYSDLVFYGMVVSITDNTSDQSPSAQEYVPFQSRVVVFKVIATWKGSPQAEAVIYTGGGGGDCGVLFTVGEERLVYAFRDDNDRFSTGICSYWRPQDV